MRLVAVVAVLDEVELIAACLRHLFDNGVERVLVFDRGSTDGTLELVESMSASEPVDIHRSSLLDPHHAVVSSTVQLDWARGIGADWMLFLDADELWIAAAGTVREVLSESTADVVSVRRYNVVVAANGPGLPNASTAESLAQRDLFVEPRVVPDDIDDPHLRWIRAAPMAKVAARPERIASIKPGQHGALRADGSDATGDVAQRLLIAHLPFTTLERFQRKARNVRETIERHPYYFEGKQGWHWRRWAGLSAEQLELEFAAQLVTQEEAETLRESGSIRSAAELFRIWAAD